MLRFFHPMWNANAQNNGGRVGVCKFSLIRARNLLP